MFKKVLVVALFCEAMSSLAFAGEPVPVAICDDAAKRAMGSPCKAYFGSNFKSTKMQGYLKQACDNGKSQWLLHTSCPAQGRVGICKGDVGKGSETWAVYYAQKQEAANACTTMLHGKWTAQ